MKALFTARQFTEIRNWMSQNESLDVFVEYNYIFSYLHAPKVPMVQRGDTSCVLVE